MVDVTELEGVCTNVGCIPSKALIAEAYRFQSHNQWHPKSPITYFEEAQALKDAVVNRQVSGVQFLLKNAGVTFVEGEASMIDEHSVVVKGAESEQVNSFKHAVLAQHQSNYS